VGVVAAEVSGVYLRPARGVSPFADAGLATVLVLDSGLAALVLLAVSGVPLRLAGFGAVPAGG
jgi:hypothetical protein